MTTHGIYSPRPTWWRPEAVEGEGWAPRARYPLSDIPALLWRERWLMLMVFLGIAAAGIVFAFTLKTVYPTHASVLVQLGQEYVYEPSAGDAARGATPTNDEMVSAETELMSSQALRMRVIQRLGYAKLNPNGARAYAAAPPDKRELMMTRLAEGIGRNLKIDSAPGVAIARLTYQADDPKVAALTLNTLLEEYLAYRRSVLSPPTAGALNDQRRAFEQQLAQEDSAYQSFLSNNRIGDFEADKTALSQLSAQIEQQQMNNDAALKEQSARLAETDAELSGLTPEATMYHDSDQTAAAKLADLKVQREALLSRYKPDAQPVKDMDAQIERLDAGIAAGRTATKGPERVGPNPIFQTLQTEKLQLAAQVAGLRQQGSALADELATLTERRLRLAQLEPQYQSLNLNRDVLQTNVKDLTAKAQENQAAQGISAATNDNIRIVERASAPSAGKSLRMPVLLLSIVFGVFTAICAGLLRVFMRPGLPTPAAAGRTLDLPVLGSAAYKQPA
jgi:uncharacterized protein involved in exopolysaccharide biosynthesis